jgi:cytoskeletal protein CcmA (bactofilin family)
MAMTKGKSVVTMTWRTRRRREPEGGFALVSAMIFLVVLLFVGASLVQTSSQELQTASRVRKESRSLNLAEAGVDYAAWKLYNAPSTALPVTWTRSDLPTGSFTVTASRYVDSGGNPVADTVVLQSTGTSQGWPAQVKVVGRFLQNGGGSNNPIFDNALFSNADLNMNGTANITGDVQGNGNISMNGSPTIDGDVTAAGSIKKNGSVKITGVQTPNAPKAPMPVIDLAHYRSIATRVVPNNYNFNGSTDLGTQGITYVDGNCNINGTFHGTGVIVCKGTVNINGNSKLESLENDHMAIIAAGSVRVNGTCRIEGFIYTHNVDVPAGFSGNGTADIYGGVVADVINVNGTIKIEYQAPTLDMPGATSAPSQFAAISWRRVR